MVIFFSFFFIKILCFVFIYQNAFIGIKEVLNRCVQKSVTTDDVYILRKWFPFFAEFLYSAKKEQKYASIFNNISVFPGLIDILHKLIIKLDIDNIVIQSEKSYSDFQKFITLEEDLQKGIWLPSLEWERPFPKYKAGQRDKKGIYRCNKDNKGKHSTLLPGMFTIMCPHGFYLGLS